MAQSLPLVLVPGLTCTARLYGPQVAALWPFGPVTVADHRRDGEIGAVAQRILDNAPPRFALAGLSYGGYIAFEMMRQAADRVVKLALLDTSARADTPEQTAGRNTQIAMAQGGRYGEIADLSIPRYLNAKHQRDERLTALVRDMVAQTGPEAFVLQLKAIMSRPDSRSMLARYAVRHWCWSAPTTRRRRSSSTRKSPTALPARRFPSCRTAGISPRSSNPRR